MAFRFAVPNHKSVDEAPVAPATATRAVALPSLLSVSVIRKLSSLTPLVSFAKKVPSSDSELLYSSIFLKAIPSAAIPSTAAPPATTSYCCPPAVIFSDESGLIEAILNFTGSR